MNFDNSFGIPPYFVKKKHAKPYQKAGLCVHDIIGCHGP